MERTEFQQKMAELKEQSERRRYEALRKKYAIAPDFTNMSLSDEIGARYDLDELEQLKQKFGTGNNTSVDDAFDILNVKSNTQALLNVLQGYKQMQPLRINDKYKHSVISCLGAQGGLPSTITTAGLGVAKEVYDIARKFPNSQNYGGYSAIVNDSFNDLLADGRGLVQGYSHPTGDCYSMMKNFYPVNIR